MVGSNKLIEDMTQYERLDIRSQNCGSFEKALIEAWFKADHGNKAILEKAFKNTNFDLT
tara:strand:- start:319 stop:495 length:177 start_codon:yes stop_codon:yes gene_type:complete